MVEYLYNAIRATSGDNITLAAKITDDAGEAVVDSCSLILYDNEKEIATVNGVFDFDIWEFNLPTSITSGLKGRYWYSVKDNDNKQIECKQPIYFI